MEQSQNTKIILIAVVILLVLGIGYVLLKDRISKGTEEGKPSSYDAQRPMNVVVENTPAHSGALSVPEGFPEDIPVETSTITESTTTNYPDRSATQLSVSYQSSKKPALKYQEYKDYMSQAGFTIKEGDVSSPVKIIFGTKSNINLTVAISGMADKTLVQISYLVK